MPSKEHILSEMRRLAEANGGVPLGMERFAAASGIERWHWLGRYWARWSEAVREAGLEPGAWQGKQHDDEALVRILADLTREFDHLPTNAEITLRRRADADVPNAQVFSNRLGSKATQHARVLAFARSHPDYPDVAAMCAATSPRTPTPQAIAEESVVTGVVYLIRMGEFHKIGKSNDAGRRNYELGLRLPEKHDVVHVIDTDDPSGIEAYWHRRFASQRANGEWFRLSPTDITAFQRRTYM